MWAEQVQAQSIDTQPLAVTSVCAGAPLEVRGRTAGVTGDLAVELSSDGITFSAIPSVPLSTTVSGEVLYRAIIPVNTLAGRNYQIRLSAKNLSVTGTPSPTTFAVKAKPAPPRVDSLRLECMRVLASGDISTHITTTAAVGATVNFYWYYNNTLVKSNYYYSRYTYASSDYVIFEIQKTFSLGRPYKYPMEEELYYFTQTLDGCESDTAKMTYRVLYRPFQGPTPANPISVYEVSHWPDIYYGSVNYCIGDKAIPVNLNGHELPPENYEVHYLKKDSGEPETTFPPLPTTNAPSSTEYYLRLYPIDPSKGCKSWTISHLTVNVSLPPSGTITGGKTLLEWESTPASLSVNLSGRAAWRPFTFILQDSSALGLGVPRSLTSFSGEDLIFNVKPLITTSYTIKSISNGCLNDTFKASTLVKVIPLLGVEDPVLADAIEVFPIPVTTAVNVHIPDLPPAQTAILELVDLTGHSLGRQEIRQTTASIPLDKHPPGTYLLQVQVGDRKATKRIVKL
ncbi:T9SS type A sorting domain-containing protein [Spirosoma gilvum]